MAHVSLYRKYRSQTFNELVGQDHVVRALQNAVSSKRIAHAFLFTGPRGTGKTSTARLLAKCLCATGGPDANPDPESEMSRMIAEGSCPDVVEMDAASESGVDDIRQAIVEAVEYRPMIAPCKVYIIDEVHDLSSKAFDALLKTIEEPPDFVFFVLATTEYSKVPPTIRSRCQKYEFHRGGLPDLIKRLEQVAALEKAEVEPPAMAAIARMADGGFRDALTLLEQALLTSNGTVTLSHVQEQLGLASDEVVDSFLEAVVNNQPELIMKSLETAAKAGRDPRAVLESMMYRLSDLSRAAYGIDDTEIDGNLQAQLNEASARLGRSHLLALRVLVADAYKAIRDVSLPRLWLESIAIGWGQMLVAPAKPIQNAQHQGQIAKPVPQQGATQTKSEPGQNLAATSKVDVKSASESSQNEESRAKIGNIEPHPDNAKWIQVVSTIEPESHLMKLKESVLIDRTDSKLVVQLTQKLYVNWYKENPHRLRYISKQATDVFEALVTVEFQSPRLATSPKQPETVQLPVEGQALHEKLVAQFKP